MIATLGLLAFVGIVVLGPRLLAIWRYVGDAKEVAIIGAVLFGPLVAAVLACMAVSLVLEPGGPSRHDPVLMIVGWAVGGLGYALAVGATTVWKPAALALKDLQRGIDREEIVAGQEADFRHPMVLKE